MLLGIWICVNGIVFLIYVISPPPCLCSLSVRMGVKFVIFGVFCLLVSLVSCMSIMSMSCLLTDCSSSCFFLVSPLMFICIMLRVLFLCVCVWCWVARGCGVGVGDGVGVGGGMGVGCGMDVGCGMGVR